MYDAYVRAKTSDGRWASVNVVDLDERSWRRFVASKLVEAGVLVGITPQRAPEEVDSEPLTTPLTKEQAECS